MENNPELERAEIELEKELCEERKRKEKYSFSDYIIAFASIVHFLFAIASPFILTIMLLSISDGAKIPMLVVWLVLPSGLVSLGTSLGFFRILELSKPQIEQ